MKTSRPKLLISIVCIASYICTFTAQLIAQPQPEIVHTDIPTIWELDNPDPVIIEISARNQGTWSDEGNISVSFQLLNAPGDCDSGIISIYPGCDDELGDYCFPHGTEIHDCDCNEFDADYLLYEGVDWDWNYDELNNYCLQYYPEEPGLFVIYYRTAAHDPEGGVCDYYRDPMSSSYYDQQGCPVYRHEVYITCHEDDYEEDNNHNQATLLVENEPQDHNLCQIGDEDWFRVEVNTTGWFDIETSGENNDDTQMWLYLAPDVENWIAYDDDSGDGYWSEIRYWLLAGVTYFVKIQEYDDDDWIEHYAIELVEPSFVEEQTSPAELKLQQNFPNPFNPSTTIEFSLLNAGMVEFTMYDIIGSVVDQYRGAYNQGASQFTWNAESLPSGVYFLKVSNQYVSQTRKCMLLK